MIANKINNFDADHRDGTVTEKASAKAMAMQEVQENEATRDWDKRYEVKVRLALAMYVSLNEEIEGILDQAVDTDRSFLGLKQDAREILQHARERVKDATFKHDVSRMGLSRAEQEKELEKVMAQHF